MNGIIGIITIFRRKTMNRLFIEYPKCSTCRKAKKYLEEHQVAFEDRHIVENNPTAEELKEWISRSGLPVKKFFNTSGKKYKEMELKNKLPEMNEDEQIALLASDGMLVKRPIIVEDDRVLVGFKEAEWTFEN
ncbi:MAG TPA: ArsC family transcriptional regulator [Lachnospiraceae bacterium]|nr:ArsC family transcriptional regulator [Lachnospiraceae bacterium]